MLFRIKKIIFAVFISHLSLVVQAAPTGKKAAMKYFTPQSKQQIKTRKPASAGGGERLISLAMGSLLNSKSYLWQNEEFLGWNIEASYLREGEGVFGQGLHLEMQKFSAEEQEFSKLAFLFSLNFPRRLSFPVYIGVAAGPGFFLKQAENESELTFDYKGYVGFRLNQPHAQYFLQSGVKNHLHVLSDGQFIGWFISSGVAYKF